MFQVTWFVELPEFQVALCALIVRLNFGIPPAAESVLSCCGGGHCAGAPFCHCLLCMFCLYFG